MSSTAAQTKNTLVIMPCKTILGHTERVRGVAHLHDGQRIITCSSDGSLRLWDLKSGAPTSKYWRDRKNKPRAWTIALSPSGKTVASGWVDGTVRLWDVEIGKVIAKLKGHATAVEVVCWSPDGKRVVSGLNDGTARVWDVKSSGSIQGMSPIKTGQKFVNVVSYSPKTTKIATSGFIDGIKIWDGETGQLLSKINHEQSWSLTWTSDEKKLISGATIGSIMIFDTVTWQQIAVLEGHGHKYVSVITLSPDNRLLASASWDNTARLWNLDTSLQIGPPLEHTDTVEGLAFSPDGKLLSTACADKNAYVWNISPIIEAASLKDLPSIPDAPKAELTQNVYASSHDSASIEYISRSSSGSSQDIEDKSFLEADATQGFNYLGDADELSPGFFDGTQVNAHFSVKPHAHPNVSALLGRFSSLLHPHQPNEEIDTQQPPVTSESRSHALLNRLSSLLRSPPKIDKISELPQPPTRSQLHPQVLLSSLFSGLDSTLMMQPNLSDLKRSRGHVRVSSSVTCPFSALRPTLMKHLTFKFTYGKGKLLRLVAVLGLSKLLHNETSRPCMFPRRGKRRARRQNASSTLHGGFV